MKVLRVRVTKNSRLVGKTVADVQFRDTYNAAIVAVQQGGRNLTQSLSSITFGAGDILVLQVSADCPLLTPSVASMVVKSANQDYVSNANSTPINRMNPFGIDNVASNDSELNNFLSYLNGADLPPSFHKSIRIEEKPTPINHKAAEAVRRDLTVLSTGIDGSSSAPKSKEFLVAMRLLPKSTLSGKSIEENGITRVPGVYVVSIERPNAHQGTLQSYNSEGHAYNTIDPDEPLKDGDILWFAGDASSVGDLRKIPGLESPEDGEIKQMNENVHDRVLDQAVVARSGPLVGKTVREVGFRTKYGAAVISVHREGHRIHEHPGNIKLHAGDVLLLEAGPTFFKKSSNSDHAFALLAEAKDSAPPRMKLLIPAVILMVTVLVVSGFDFENFTLLICSTFAGIVMCAIGLLSPQEARDPIDWALYVAIACSFGISQALTNSGLAAVCANFLITVGQGSGLGGKLILPPFLFVEDQDEMLFLTCVVD